MKKQENIVLQNTFFLSELIQTNSGIDVVKKWKALKQLEENLKYLKNSLSYEEYLKDLSEVEARVNRINEKLNDPSFWDKIKEIVNNFVTIKDY